jgi:hypothetical protein
MPVTFLKEIVRLDEGMIDWSKEVSPDCTGRVWIEGMLKSTLLNGYCYY